MLTFHARLFITAASLFLSVFQAAGNWPQFRGPNASGISENGKPPIQFGPSEKLLWKSPVPPGLSAPVVWNERIFLTAKAGEELVTLAYDRRNGRELWRRTAPAEKVENCHEFSSPAASTPCTDGQRVYVYFGSFGLIAYDFDGKEIWRRSFQTLPTKFGTASSPIVADGRVILQRDGDSTNAQVVALAPESGKILWEAARPLAGGSYSTPMVWRHDGIDELMVQGIGRLSAYEPANGKLKWWVRGWGFTAVTTPVAGDGLLFAGGSGLGDPVEPPDPVMNWKNLIAGQDKNKDGQLAVDEVAEDLVWHMRKEIPKEVPGNSLPMRFLLGTFVDSNGDKVVTKAEWEASEAYASDKFNADRFVAIRPGGAADSTDTHVVWETTRGLSEMPSPLFYKGRVHFLRDGGLWTVVNPKNGRRLVDRERIGIGGQVVASPIAANGYIYVVNEPGTFAVLRAGDTMEVVATNKIGESVRATPAIVGGTIFVRSREHLWAFGN